MGNKNILKLKFIPEIMDIIIERFENLRENTNKCFNDLNKYKTYKYKHFNVADIMGVINKDIIKFGNCCTKLKKVSEETKNVIKNIGIFEETNTDSSDVIIKYLKDNITLLIERFNNNYIKNEDCSDIRSECSKSKMTKKNIQKTQKENELRQKFTYLDTHEKISKIIKDMFREFESISRKCLVKLKKINVENENDTYFNNLAENVENDVNEYGRRCCNLRELRKGLCGKFFEIQESLDHQKIIDGLDFRLCQDSSKDFKKKHHLELDKKMDDCIDTITDAIYKELNMGSSIKSKSVGNSELNKSTCSLVSDYK